MTEENELEVVEETTNSEEPTEVEETEVEEIIEEDENDSDSPTLEDFKELEKKAKTLEAQKEHWRKKAETVKTDKPINKINNNKTENNLDEETLIRISQVASRLDDDDLEVLKTIQGSSIADKMDNLAFKAYKAQKDKKKRSEASALRPSGSATYTAGNSFAKPELSAEEHRKLYDKAMS